MQNGSDLDDDCEENDEDILESGDESVPSDFCSR